MLSCTALEICGSILDALTDALLGSCVSPQEYSISGAPENAVVSAWSTAGVEQLLRPCSATLSAMRSDLRAYFERHLVDHFLGAALTYLGRHKTLKFTNIGGVQLGKDIEHVRAWVREALSESVVDGPGWERPSLVVEALTMGPQGGSAVSGGGLAALGDAQAWIGRRTGR